MSSELYEFGLRFIIKSILRSDWTNEDMQTLNNIMSYRISSIFARLTIAPITPVLQYEVESAEEYAKRVAAHSLKVKGIYKEFYGARELTIQAYSTIFGLWGGLRRFKGDIYQYASYVRTTMTRLHMASSMMYRVNPAYSISWIPDPNDTTVEGGVIAAVFINRVLVGADDESVGYLVPSTTIQTAMVEMSFIMRRLTDYPKPYPSSDPTMINIIMGFLRDAGKNVMPTVFKVGFDENFTKYGSDGKVMESESRKTVKLATKKNAVAFYNTRSNLTTRRREDQFKANYRQYILSVQAMIVDFDGHVSNPVYNTGSSDVAGGLTGVRHGGIWIQSRYEGVMVPLGDEPLRVLIGLYKFPTRGCLRISLSAGNMDEPHLLSDIFVKYMVYGGEVVGNIFPNKRGVIEAALPTSRGQAMELNISYRRVMIDALKYMMERLRIHFASGRCLFVNARYIAFEVSSEGVMLSHVKVQFLPMPVDKFLLHCIIAINQLTSMNSDAIVDTMMVSPNDKLNEYMTGLREHTTVFVDPFWFDPIIIFPEHTLASHKAVSGKQVEFLILACSECKNQNCIELACKYCLPMPNAKEMNELSRKTLIAYKGIYEMMKHIKSLPWMVVTNPTADRNWSVLACWPEGLKTCTPISIDVSSVLVLCDFAKHMYRVSKIMNCKIQLLDLTSVTERQDDEVLNDILNRGVIPVNLFEKDETKKEFMDYSHDMLVDRPKIIRRWTVLKGPNVLPDDVDFSDRIVLMKHDGCIRRVKDLFINKHKCVPETYIKFGCYLCHISTEEMSPTIIDALLDGVAECVPAQFLIEAIRSKRLYTRAILLKYLGSKEIMLDYKAENTESEIEVKDIIGHEELQSMGIPDIVFVVKSKSGWKVDAHIGNSPTAVEFMNNKDKYIVIYHDEGKNIFYRVLDYYGPRPDDEGNEIIRDRRSWLKISRRPTLVGTLNMCTKLTPEDRAAIMNGDFIMTDTVKFINKFGRDSEDGEMDVLKFNKEIVDDIFPTISDNLWVDSDGTIWKIDELCPIDVKNSLYSSDTSYPLLIIYDDETADMIVYSKKCGVDTLILRVIMKDNSKITKKGFKGPTCAEEFIEWVYQQAIVQPYKRKVLCYGYNSSGFDIYKKIDALSKNDKYSFGFGGTGSRLVKAHAKIIELSWRNVHFRDVMRFSGGSLKDAANSLKCKKVKTCWSHVMTQEIYNRAEGNFDRFKDLMLHIKAEEFMEPSLYPGMPDDARILALKEYSDACIGVNGKTAWKAFKEYCSNDCEVTLEVMCKLREAYYSITGGSIDLFKFMTREQACYKLAMQMANGNLYLPKSAKEYKFYRDAILAGRSEVFRFAPLRMQELSLLLVDVVSLYPFVMSQCPFPLESEVREVTEFIPNMLGVYEINITKQAVVPIIPLKRLDSGLGGHLWGFKKPFHAIATNIHILDHRFFGGECTIIRGYVYPKAARGIFTEFVEVFKKIKQEQDRISDTPDYNPAMREASKQSPNGVSGKMIEDFIRNINVVRAHRDDKKEVRDDMLKYLKTDVCRTKLIDTQEDLNLKVECFEDDYPELITAKMTPKRFFDLYKTKFGKKYKLPKFLRSTVTGLFIYAWSHHHMIWAILQRTYLAKAAYMTETDSLAFDWVKYEALIGEHFPMHNPYDMPPPPREKEMLDKCFDMPVAKKFEKKVDGKYRIGTHPALSNKRLGYFYCPKAAMAWYKIEENRKLYLAHNNGVEWKPHDEKGLTEFGDFTVECGIDSKLDYYKNECVFITKKCYYITRHEDKKHPGPKMRFKGVGKGTKEASKLVKFLVERQQYFSCGFGIREEPLCDISDAINKRDLTDEDKIEYTKLMKEITTAPSIITKDFYLKLSQCQEQFACEHRFRGCLSDIINDGIGLYASWIIKRIQPSLRYKLIVRTTRDGDNPHGNTIYECEYPASEPKGKPPCTVSVNKKKVSSSDMKDLAFRLQGGKKTFNGLTVKLLSGWIVYITPTTAAFIRRYVTYFYNTYA